MTSSAGWQRARVLLLVVGLLIAAAAVADEPGCEVELGQLQHMSECELEQLFTRAQLGEPPCGCLRGHVLLLTGGKLPRLRAKLSGCVWRGKCFGADGWLVNQFPGFRAIQTQGAPGPSWLDGKPCLVVEYPLDTPLFGNNRDEIRQLGTGLYIVRLYERCPCPKLAGYLALEARCK